MVTNLLAAVLATVFLSYGSETFGASIMTIMVKPTRAICVLEAANIRGNIYLSQQKGDNVLINGRITGVPPGKHGFHIHQYGDLSGGCSSTGGHYNPDSFNHSSPDAQQKHVGDLGNIVTDCNGTVVMNMNLDFVDLSGQRSVIGRAMVLHAKEDDLGQGGNVGSIKTGNAGSRLACCVIGYEKI